MGTISNNQLLKNELEKMKTIYGLSDADILKGFVSLYIKTDKAEQTPEESFAEFLNSPSVHTQDISSNDEENDDIE